MNLEFEENITKRGGRKRGHTEGGSTHIENPKTPTTRRCVTMSSDEPKTPVHILNLESEQTPRRSGRKSVKPVQEYDEIVTGRSGRNLRSIKKEVPLLELEEIEEAQPKWTPAKVGRVSQKRSIRKSSRKTKTLKKLDDECEEVKSDLKSDEGDSEKLDQLDDDVFSADAQTSSVLNTTFDKIDTEKNMGKELPAKTDLIEFELAPIVYGADDEVIQDEGTDGLANVNAIVGVETSTKCIETAENINTEKKEHEKSENISSAVHIELKCSPSQCLENKSLSIGVQKKVDMENNFEKHSENDNHCQKHIEREEDQEMPSLIFCDDDDEDLKDKENSSKEGKGDDTFNTSDCIVISPADNASQSQSLAPHPSAVSPKNEDSPLIEAGKKVKELQTKYLKSIKTKTPNLPHIVVTLAEQENLEMNKHLKTPISTTKTIPRSTTGSTAKRNLGGTVTPQSTKNKPGYRFPTPFKTNMEFSFSKIGNANVVQHSNPSPKTKVPILTTLEPRDIVLRSIRKRSLSVAVGGEEHKRKALNVTFYSPANQTATTEEMDQLIAKSALKTDAKNKIKTMVTRKRSISLDENTLRFQSKLPRRVKTPTKLHKSPSKSSARTKIPNFAAIHEKQFQKMENIVDYVARKAERAQNLTNSALKAQNGILSIGVPSKSPRKTKPLLARALPLDISSTKKSSSGKLKERRERHMAMFKGCADLQTDKKRKNNELIKGVRSNRRFELLMQHRKTNGN